MNTLFDEFPSLEGPYRVPSAPLASPRDPSTSHDAGEQHERSGKAETNRRFVLMLVRENPGMTSVELHAAQGDRSDLDRHEVSRRLADLKNAGTVRQGPARACSIKGTEMVSWFVVEESNGR